MLRLFRKPVKPAGAPPGTLVHTGHRKADHVRITLIDYDRERYEEREVSDVAECLPHLDDGTVTWINVDGLHEVEVIRILGESLHIHPLVLEDVLHVDQRPKVEDHNDYLFIVTKMLNRNETGDVEAEHVSLLLGPDWVLSFQEMPGDLFGPIRDRLRQGKGRIRSLGADYLCYRLLDTIVDHYFVLLNDTAGTIEALENELEEDPDEVTLRRIHALKHELLFLRRQIWPLREALRELESSETDMIGEEVRTFLTDVRDHIYHVIETVDTFRDMASGMQDLYLSTVSNRMNEVMKVLTIIATIFIPLTFIAGIYGMNFAYMPELGWRAGYFIILGVMAVLAGVMVVYFRRKKWL